MPEFRIRLEFYVEVDNPSHIDAAFAAADHLQELARDSRLSYLTFDVASLRNLHDGQGTQFKTVDLEDVQSVDDPDPLPNIGDTCCGKCPGGTCYVDQITGA